MTALIVTVVIVLPLAVVAIWGLIEWHDRRKLRAREAVIAHNLELLHRARQDQGRYLTDIPGSPE